MLDICTAAKTKNKRKKKNIEFSRIQSSTGDHKAMQRMTHRLETVTVKHWRLKLVLDFSDYDFTVLIRCTVMCVFSARISEFQ